MNKSIATLDSPEFLNLQPMDINPLMSKCEIKVLYTGENRNHSFISEEVAAEMAKTLRGAPIVGYYKEEKGDFRDHGNCMTIEDGGIKFSCLTVPYGFVAPDADVWFQNFEDTDEFGNVEKRKYLMTTGYLWTGQFEEAKLAVEGEGRPQSMELDEETLQGRWATNKKSGMDFFIINDAIFSKLCILGTDVEPCFEGASVTAPSAAAASYSLDDKFKNTLFSMMQELKNALQGGNMVDNNVKDTTEITATVTTDFQAETTPEAAPVAEEAPVVDSTVDPVVDNQAPDSFAAKKKDDEEDDENKKDPETSKDDSKGDDGEKEGSKGDDKKDPEKEEEDKKKDDEDEEKKKKKYDLEQDFIALGAKYSELETSFAALQSEKLALETEVAELRQFKLGIEDAKKDDMIKSFYMLSDEDKKEVVENKSKYSLEEIESKLSVICVRKKVAFNLDADDKKDETKEPLTYTLDSSADIGATPAWISAVINNRK